MLIDPDIGRSISVSLLETEEALRQGHVALSQMNPSGSDVGRRTSVESDEVGVGIRRVSRSPRGVPVVGGFQAAVLSSASLP